MHRQTFKFWDGYREFDTEAREILNGPGKATSKTYYSKDSYKLQANGTSVTHVIGPDFRHPLNTVFSRLSFKSLDNVDSKKTKLGEAYMNIFMLQNNKSKHQDYLGIANRFSFHEIGHLTAAFVPAFKYTDVVVDTLKFGLSFSILIHSRSTDSVRWDLSWPAMQTFYPMTLDVL